MVWLPRTTVQQQRNLRRSDMWLPRARRLKRALFNLLAQSKATMLLGSVTMILLIPNTFYQRFVLVLIPGFLLSKKITGGDCFPISGYGLALLLLLLLLLHAAGAIIPVYQQN